MKKDKEKILPSLNIGDLQVYPPFIQGGMGVRVSRAGLASAVANEGCVGVIASVGLGRFEDASHKEYADINEKALRQEIQKARKLSDGIIGVNLMMVLTDFESLVKASVDEGVDLIIAGAGIPKDLPKYLGGKNIKLVPIVSSARAFKLICNVWGKRYNKTPDAVIVEGPMAGGHLGFSHEDLVNGKTPKLAQIVAEVLDVANSFSSPIPVIAAGGIFDGKDIVEYLKMGVSGVQMATRFICTDECDVHESFKRACIDAGVDDLAIIKSPVGLPGRVIRNAFVDRILAGDTIPFECPYLCLKGCNPATVPFCIAKALTNASDGNFDEGFVFVGKNVHRLKEIVSVKELINTLVEETLDCLSRGVDGADISKKSAGVGTAHHSGVQINGDDLPAP
ncbi:MAG: nitronate monooxygenase family protein [Thermodesulfobacteriota bacterium]